MTGAGISPARPVPDRRLIVAVGVLALVPVVYMLGRAIAAARNVPYMDDIDGALMLLLRLHEGGSARDLVRWMFEVNNEHRMVTSRLLHAVSYALTGTINFAFVGMVGNLFLCGLCGLLIGAAGTVERKCVLALLLAGLLFQLEHFENFFWSGSSIDHFQVPLLAGATVILLARRGWRAWLGATALAVLALFTLAHGLMIWPVGGLMLALDRRWRQLAAWIACGGVAGAAYFSGFAFNAAHQVGGFSLLEMGRIARYWLEIMGAPLALGHASLAVAAGAGLVALLGWQIGSGGLKRERIALPLALWAVAALGLVAIGRAGLGGGVSVSRYYVLAALAWALGVFALLQQRGDRGRMERTLLWLGPVLVVFNIAANVSFAGPARRWLADRDEAAANFVRHGRDGVGKTSLHPLPRHATRVIRQAEKSGVFTMARESVERALPELAAGAGFPFAVDRVAVDENLVTIDGWAAGPGRVPKPGDVSVVLRAAEGEYVLTTSGVLRPDVAAAFPHERWQDAGFHFSLRRWLVPPESYRLGLIVPTERGAALVMTEQRVELGGGPGFIETDKVAPNRAVYDELSLRTPAASVVAAPNKFMRVSFFDLHDGLVHVDLSGPGEMTVTLGDATPLNPLPRERGWAVAHMKGSATIAITGADEATNVAVFSARRQPRRGTTSEASRGVDGLAHIAAISIVSRDGRFGGVRTGNVDFAANSGRTGIHAPGVHFTGPVNIGDISAFASANPEIDLGFAAEVRVTGGDLHQPNGQAVKVNGLSRLRFVEGRTAQGAVLPARSNRARLKQGGRDVTAQIAEGP